MRDNSKKRGGRKFSIWFLIVLIVCGCCYWLNIRYGDQPRVPDHLYTVTEFLVCTGLDENENPVESSEILSNDRTVSACGYVQTNEPVALVVSWSHEGAPIFREILYSVQGRFISHLQPKEETFPGGNYEIKLIILKSTVWEINFQVEPD